MELAHFHFEGGQSVFPLWSLWGLIKGSKYAKKNKMSCSKQNAESWNCFSEHIRPQTSEAADKLKCLLHSFYLLKKLRNITRCIALKYLRHIFKKLENITCGALLKYLGDILKKLGNIMCGAALKYLVKQDVWFQIRCWELKLFPRTYQTTKFRSCW